MDPKSWKTHTVEDEAPKSIKKQCWGNVFKKLKTTMLRMMAQKTKKPLLGKWPQKAKKQNKVEDGTTK